MLITITVTAEVERTEGKFESKDVLAEQLVEAIEQADPGDLEGENEGRYEVVEWSVEVAQPPKAMRTTGPRR